MHFIATHASGWFEGAAFYGIMAYGARTFPVPQNVYAKWLVGLVQFGLSNYERGMAAFGTTSVVLGQSQEPPVEAPSVANPPKA